MKHVAIFMSDFHLGQRNRTEEFFVDEEFGELLGGLSLQHAEDKVDLVLLGDVLDLWATIIDKKEVRADQIDDVDLYLPLKRKKDMKNARKQEIKKIKAIVDSHPLFFEALGRFLTRDPQKRRIVYVYGNHDHSFVDPELQSELRQKILSKAVLEWAEQCTGIQKTKLESFIEFKAYYVENNLQVYAEHGNQLTYEGIFRYDNKHFESTFDKFGPECPGYVYFKTITSRVIRAAPKLNGLLMGVFNPANWPSLAGWLLFRGYFRAFIYMQRFQIQYKASTDWRIRWARENMPGPWNILFFVLKMRLRSVTKDEFGDVIPKLFEKDNDPLFLPLCKRKLSPDTTKTIVLGHSHGSRDIDVPCIEGLKYYNTGSWTLRREKNREIVEQTWVLVSMELTELPLTITSIQSLGSMASLAANDEFGKTHKIQLRNIDALKTLKRNDRIVLEIDNKGMVKTDKDGFATKIALDNTRKIKIIDRELVRRRVERTDRIKSPVTFDGALLNPELRSMNLQVGDLILFHWNFGPYLWRLARSFSFGELFAAIPRVIIAFINRFGTSSYWNHIAMVYGSPSEPSEAEHYNDPLIIESVPNLGVSIHTPEHYVKYPKEWDFAVLRLTGPLLKSWKARRLLRRITLNYLGAAYDKKSVTRGTIQYAAFATSTKGRSALGGIVIGALLSVFLFSVSAVWLIWKGRHSIWALLQDAWQKSRAAQFAQTIENCLSETFNLSPNSVVDIQICLMTIFALMVGAPFAIYLVLQLGRLLLKTWVVLTASVGAALGACIVPIMTDMTNGWAEKSVAERYGFSLIWFSPLLILILSKQLIVSITGQPTEPASDEYFRLKVMLILASVLITVLFAGMINSLAESFIRRAMKRGEALKRLINQLYITLKWPLATSPTINRYPLHKQFICSGLVQDALVETVRALGEPSQENRTQTEQPPFPPDMSAKHYTSELQEVEQPIGAGPVRVADLGTVREWSRTSAQNPSFKQIGISQERRNDVLTEVDADAVQDAVIKNARGRLAKSDQNELLEQVIVNPDWKEVETRPRADQSRVLRDTLPRHFALEQQKFEWIYLYLDQVLTPNPSESCKAQAYTDPLETGRESPPLVSIWAIKSGFTGIALTMVSAFYGDHLSKHLGDIFSILLHMTAMFLGVLAILFSRLARKDLACYPHKRGRALTIGGFISGAFAILLGFGGLEGMQELEKLIVFVPFMTKVVLFLFVTALLTGFLLLF
jgi:UDP-2,3-diacylglucosamine pyrophosphatase LpxH